MQLKICIKRSLAHILCSYAKNGVISNKGVQIIASKQHSRRGSGHPRLPGTYADRSLKGSRPLALSC